MSNNMVNAVFEVSRGLVWVATILPAGGFWADALDWLTAAAIALLFFLYGARLSPAETLAGLVYEHLKRVPEENEALESNGLRIIVKEMRGRKIVLAKVLRLD